MHTKVDQSGKLEDTSKNTAIGASNERAKSILLKAKDKRKLQAIFRARGRGRVFVYKTFASLIYMLIKDDLNKIDKIIIDQEYQGHEAEIKHYLLQIIRKSGKGFDKDNIDFAQIGKKAKAHRLAHKVYRGEKAPDIIADLDELIEYLFRVE